MSIVYFALLVVVVLLIWGLVIMVRRMTRLAAFTTRSLSDDPDALQQKLIPLLAYLALVSILIKLTVF